MKRLYIVIVDAGDGSNGLCYTFDRELIEKMDARCDDLDSCYMSGDGLQVRGLNVPDDYTYATLGISEWSVLVDPFSGEDDDA